ncbi:MAG: hypothetical protein ACD_2C00154G0003 [uncultured bacterium (gcode 4)]|uniref:Uncharacterized protein n=1 Tax=uncultured bacterium (gcode 4) TaxID=1234023 RepID=K2FEC2_9BACT|nr:MAG: hypothetical protein ACD_2C00154G0003 [uncultured bacterium (gcode 4)]
MSNTNNTRNARWNLKWKEAFFNDGIDAMKSSFKANVSAILSEDEIGDLEALCRKKPDFWRIYLLRHLPVVKNAEYESIKARITKKQKLKKGEKELFEKLDSDMWIEDTEMLSDELKSAFDEILGSDRKEVFYDNSEKQKKRIAESIRWMMDNFPRLNFRWIHFPWTEKSKGMFKAMIEAWGDFDAAFDSAVQHGRIRWNEMIMVWNRSYAYFFDFKKWDRKTWIDESEKRFEGKGYEFMDIDSKWTPLNNDWNLIITPDNYRKILALFWLSGKITMTYLQSWLNKYLADNPEICRNLLKQNLWIEWLNMFCIKRIIDKWWFEDILRYLESSELSEEELKKILPIAYAEKERDNYELWKIIWFKLKKITSISLQREFRIREEDEERISSDLREISGLNEKTDANIREIFERSIDKAIHREENLICRKTYSLSIVSDPNDIWRKKLNMKIPPTLKKTSYGISEMLEDEEMYKFVLLENVWEWKSTQLAKMAREAIKNHPEYFIVFLKASDFSMREETDSQGPMWNIEESHSEAFPKWTIYIHGENIDSILKRIDTYFPNRNFLIFADWIDEIDSKIKEKVKNILLNRPFHKKYVAGDSVIDALVWHKIIMWSRKNEFNESGDENLRTIFFEQLSMMEKEDFIESRLKQILKKDDCEAEYKIIRNFLESWKIWSEWKNNPLILYFIILLSTKGLPKIKNKAELYEAVVRYIITEQNFPKWNRIFKQDSYHTDIEMDRLWKIAYEIFNKKKLKDIPDSSITSLSVLFKVDWEDKYAFIHRSFYEYFLARHFSWKRDWDKSILQKRDSFARWNWNDWRNFRPVLLNYCEILYNSGKIWSMKKLEWFLGEWWLLKDDDVYGDWFFIWLEFLISVIREQWTAKWPLSGVIGLYISKIRNFNIEDILIKIWGFQELQKKIGAKDNIFAQEFYRKYPKSKNSTIDMIRLWTLESLEFVSNEISESIRGWNYEDICSFCIEMSKVERKEFVMKALEFSEIFIKSRDTWALLMIYNEAMKCSFDWFEEIIAELLYKIWDLEVIWGICASIMRKWDKMSVDFVQQTIQEIHRESIEKNLPNAMWWIMDVIKELINHRSEKSIKICLGYAELFKDSETPWITVAIYKEMIKSWYYEAFNSVRNALDQIYWIMEHSLVELASICAKSWKKEWIEIAYLIIDRRSDEISFSGIEQIVREMSKFRDSRWLALSVKIADKFYLKADFLSAWKLYMEIVKSWGELNNNARKCAEMLYAGWEREQCMKIFVALYKKWEKSLIPILEQHWKRLVIEEEFFEAGWFYKDFYVHGDKKSSDICLKWADALIESDRSDAEIILSEMLDSWDYSVIGRLSKYARESIEKGHVFEINKILIKLYQTGYEEWKLCALEWAEKLMDSTNDGLLGAYRLYIALMEAWELKYFSSAYSCILKFIMREDLKTSAQLYVTLLNKIDAKSPEFGFMTEWLELLSGKIQWSDLLDLWNELIKIWPEKCSNHISILLRRFFEVKDYPRIYLILKTLLDNWNELFWDSINFGIWKLFSAWCYFEIAKLWNSLHKTKDELLRSIIEYSIYKVMEKWSREIRHDLLFSLKNSWVKIQSI